MAIEIVSFPIKKVIFNSYVKLPEGTKGALIFDTGSSGGSHRHNRRTTWGDEHPTTPQRRPVKVTENVAERRNGEWFCMERPREFGAKKKVR